MGRAFAENPTTSLSAMWGALVAALSAPDRASSTCTWNYNNFLSQVSGTGTSTYKYDHAGQRVWQVMSTATSSYPNKFFSVATSTNNKGTTTEYIYAGNELVATIEGTSTQSAVTRYVHPDHLGSTNVVTDVNKNAVQTLDYYPYGGTRIDTGTDVSQREFIGQFLDEQNGLSYLNARYYENSRGQFLSQDPTHLAIGNVAEIRAITGLSQQEYLRDPQLLNSYSYGRNNPLRFKDPEGKYIEFSGSLAVPGRTFSGGLRFDGNGVDYFFGGGFGTGVSGGIGFAWVPGKELSHQREASVVVNGSASYIGGVRVSQDLSTYYPDTRTTKYGGDTDVALTLGLRGGASGSIEQDLSAPFYVWGNKSGPAQSRAPAVQTSPNMTKPVSSGPQSSSGGASLNSLLSRLSGVLSQIKTALSSSPSSGSQKKQ